jgi:hypothetical protein
MNLETPCKVSRGSPISSQSSERNLNLESASIPHAQTERAEEFALAKAPNVKNSSYPRLPHVM